MHSSPLISIIIPTYNHAGYLKEALDSLVAQTYQNWEAVVINNYSEDNTVEVVSSFDDSRIRIVNFHNNGVIGASRNVGIKLSNGEFLAFLDSDDTWYPEKLSICIKCFNESIDLVCHGLRTIGYREENIYCGPEKRVTYDFLLHKGNCLTPSATIVRKDLVNLVGGFSENPSIVTSEDYHLWIKLAKQGAKIKCIRTILGNYRIHANNQSSAVLRHLNSILQVIEDFYPENTVLSFKTSIKIRKRKSIAFYGAARALQKNKEFERAWAFFFKAVLYWPFLFKNYIAIGLNIFKYAR